jgi:hypothetical protein
MVVVVGREIVEASKDDPHTIVRAVPLSVILHKCISPSIGVPVRLVVIEVILTASAVIFVTSEVSVLLAGVADDDTVSILFVIRLFERVVVTESK